MLLSQIIRSKSTTSLLCPFKWSSNHVLQHARNQYRFVSSEQNNSADEYLSSLGYDNKSVQEGMKNALKGVFGKKITADNLKGLGTQGTFITF